MAEPGLIEAYLNELRFSLAKLADRDDLVDEVADHLYTARERLVRKGVAMAEAESQALGQFGSAALVSKVYAEEEKRGGAVSTTTTRRAGLAALAAAPLVAIGQAGNELVPRGFVHGVALVTLTAGIAAFVYALWGLRRRHGGLGRLGQVTFWWFVASPFIAAPFLWGAPFALAVQWLFISGLLGSAMLSARILPRPAVAMFTVWPVAMPFVVLAMSAAGYDIGAWFLTFFAPIAVGLMWLGWSMWNEPALDVGDRSGRLPMAPA